MGMTLDDLLRDEIHPNTTLTNQSFLVKMTTALTMIMFVGGLINSVFSFLTFKSKELRKVGCGMYLLASSITSLLTICMFTIKFWFVAVTHMNISVSLSVLRGGCVCIESILKLCIYVDSWLNVCVAVERAVNVAKGVNFNKKKSKQIAWWIIIILPFCIMATIIHESLYRDLFVYKTEKDKTKIDETEAVKTYENKTIKSKMTGNETIGNETDEYKTETYVYCMTRYSRSVQNYNTAILFFPLVVPFVVNLFSALFIIFGAARQRSVARAKQTYKEHLLEQLREHKQLVISPIILFILALPRLIISLLSGCMNTASKSWLYLSGCLISFTPPMLVFVIFVLPWDLYWKTFKQSFRSCRRQTHQ